MVQEFGTERAAQAFLDIAALVAEHRARLPRLVKHFVRDDDLAASIVQDCFPRAYSARHRFRGECSVHTWLITIATNLVRDSQRAKKVKFWRNVASTSIGARELAPKLRHPASSPERQTLAREQVEAVNRTILCLSEKQGAIFRMRFVYGLDVQEIAQAMGMPVRTTKTILLRAVHIVRAQVRKGK